MEVNVLLLATALDGYMDENVGIGRITSYLKHHGKSVKQTYLSNNNYQKELHKIDLQ